MKLPQTLELLFQQEDTEAITRSIFAKVYPHLEKGIAEAQTFFRRSAQGVHFELSPEEIIYWNEAYGLDEVVARNVLEGKLYTPDPSVFDTKKNIIEGPKQTQLISTSRTDVLDLKKIRARFNPNPEGNGTIQDVDLYRVSPEDKLSVYVRPKFHLGGQSTPGVRGLYNAFIELDTLLVNEEGLPVLDPIPGTVNGPSWAGGPVYSKFSPLSHSCWFNEKIKPEEPNSLGINFHQDGGSMFKAELHHKDQISSMKIPEDQKLRLFFWQVNQYMNQLQVEGEKKLLNA